MKRLTPKQIVLAFLLSLSIFMTMACDGRAPGDAMGIACAVDPNSSHCD